MRISLLKVSIAVVAGLAATLLIAACGSGGGGGAAQKGGTLTILETAGGVDSLDPGYWYYQSDYENLGQTTQRWLYGWKPTDTKPRPDLATGLPQASNGDKTLTIKIRPGIHYSAPLQSQTVKAADIKYAMERCFLPQVGNGYANAYYGEIQGVSAFTGGKAKEISGIQAPNATTLVLKLTKPQGVLSNANALGLPCTAPVPKDYAQKYDKGKTSTYGDHQVFTGPYMITNDGKGNVTGYKPGQSLTIVRNPNWTRTGDFRPAYLDKVVFNGGNDATVAARKTLVTSHMLSGDYATPPAPVLKSALSSKKSQVQIVPSGGVRYIALNTTVKPLDNVNVRRAISAVIDRTALRQTRGGPSLGTPSTHFIPPHIPGFDEAGGNAGPGFDFTPATSDIAVAQKYLKKAGFSSGRYTGPTLLTVADNQAPAKQTAEAFQSQVGKVGFKLQFREVPHATLIGKFCGTPKAAVAICPTLGWGKDFSDAQSFIDPLFNGKNIVPSGNVNVSQANDPKLNAQIEKAKTITEATARAKAWGNLDKEVTDQSYFVSWLWDNYVGLVGPNTKGVQSDFNGGAWDLTFSSLK
jgi:peptide/nickel transport system substrate-binding protein